MKNLIEEIEKLKPKIITNKYSDGFQNAIKMVLNKLNQYNLLTAPKSVKLSEIVERLRQCYSNRIYIERSPRYKNITICKDCIKYDEDDENITINVVEIYENKIKKIDIWFLQEYKWLYTLWITGTEIIDDLKECNE